MVPGSSAPGAATSPGFTIASYNIHQCVGSDGRCEPRRIARVLDELGADVIGLQEVDTRPGGHRESFQMAYLAEHTGLTPIAGPTMQRHEGDYGNVLLTRWPVRSVQHLELSYLRREPRRAIDAELELPGGPVRIVLTHLGLRPAERRFQVRLLLAALSARPSRLLIVMGDINEWLPAGRPLRWLDAALGRSVGLRTFPARLPAAALDRIWVRPASALTEIRVHRTALSRVASDHLPLVARVTPPGDSAP